MNSSVARLPKTSARMTSAGRQPRSFPSPQHDDVSDGDANDDDLNDMDMAVDQWRRHYFTHVRGSCRTLQESREARLEDLHGREEWRQDLSALRNNVRLLQGTLTQDLAALHSEIQQLQGAVASLVASRRKLVHPPPTRASTPSVEAISPGPSSNMRRDT
ncbi:hypothetical protein EDB86DRAFT_2837038 [Lactarius hatsudake]|nr:hypothetical protein EDB86DRAFT_2837038 [Lactarius hatsudake]